MPLESINQAIHSKKGVHTIPDKNSIGLLIFTLVKLDIFNVAV